MMTDKPLTKQQLASLEGAYHKGNPYQQRTGVTPEGRPWFSASYTGGGSRTRMINTLEERGYLTRRDGKLTAKGYAALSESNAAMKFIDIAELRQRYDDRLKEESIVAAKAEAERMERAERRRIAEETSRRERLEKLRGLLVEGHLPADPFVATDDELLAFATRVHEIMEAY